MKNRGQKPEAKSQKPKDAAQKPAAPEKPSAPPLLILISAPSGAGKTTLLELLLKAQPRMTRAITCTTREPRPGERHGVDYYFLKPADFLTRVQAGNFLEHATVYGNSYGLLKRELLDKLRAGHDVLLTVDVQGAATIRAAAESEPELHRALVTIFLTTASLDILAQRLRKRGADAAAVIEKRLAVARNEIAQWKNFDYLLISGTKQEDLRRALAIVESEKMRSSRSAPPEF
jgi:guanylate kinase